MSTEISDIVVSMMRDEKVFTVLDVVYAICESQAGGNPSKTPNLISILMSNMYSIEARLAALESDILSGEICDSTGMPVEATSYSASDVTLEDQNEYRIYHPSTAEWRSYVSPITLDVDHGKSPLSNDAFAGLFLSLLSARGEPVCEAREKDGELILGKAAIEALQSGAVLRIYKSRYGTYIAEA